MVAFNDNQVNNINNKGKITPTIFSVDCRTYINLVILILIFFFGYEQSKSLDNLF
jgi:hypothetical protein